jgi:hypothetical protein
MMTVRPAALAGAHAHAAHAQGTPAGMPGVAEAPVAMPGMEMGAHPTRPPLPVMTLLSFLALAAGVALGLLAARS